MCDKLDLSCRLRLRNSESRRDVRGEAGVESRSDGTPANHKTNLNPEQSEWVAASHGDLSRRRSTEDGRA